MFTFDRYVMWNLEYIQTVFITDEVENQIHE